MPAKQGGDLMTRTAVRLATLAIAACIALAFSPSPALGDGRRWWRRWRRSRLPAIRPVRPSTAGKKDKKKSERFLDGYRTAYATIYQRHDYATAITQLKALKHNDHRRRRQPDRLRQPQARQLRRVQGLVRGRAEGRSEPCADVAVLRPVAARAGQPGAGAGPSRQDRSAVRHVCAGVPVACGSDGHGRGRRTPGLLTAAAERKRNTGPAATTGPVVVRIQPK